MFVVTADQINSRGSTDAVGETVARLNALHGGSLPRPVDRNAGDELQAIVPSGTLAVELILELTRTRGWSVGVGAGGIEEPLPRETREARGPAFIAARDAVTRAKKSPLRFALRAMGPGQALARDADALVCLLVAIRDRRTPQGWEVYDLRRRGLTQRQIATELDISPQSVSERMSVAQITIDLEAQAPLSHLLDRLAQSTSLPDETTGTDTP